MMSVLALVFLMVCNAYAVTSERVFDRLDIAGLSFAHLETQAWAEDAVPRNGMGRHMVPRGFVTGDDLGEIIIKEGPTPIGENRALKVVVTWKHVVYGTKDSWIGVFPCKNDDERSCSPIGVYPVQFQPVKGRKELEFVILVRPGVWGYRIAYITPSVLPYPEVNAVTSIIETPKEFQEDPMYVRLSLVSGDGGAMRFMFAMSPFAQSAEEIMSGMHVRIGTQPGNYTLSVPIKKVYTYTEDDFCDVDRMPAAGAGFVIPGLQCEAIATGLAGNQKYFYTIENEKTNRRTKEQSFKTKTTDVTNLIIYGDMGQTPFDEESLQHSFDYQGKGELGAPNTSKLVRHLVEKEYDGEVVVNHIGDISYATGALALWDNWLQLVEPVSSQVPYMTAIGNHEYGFSRSFIPGTDSQGECGVPYSSFFPFASQVKEKDVANIHTRAQDEPWYSFEYGMAHITMMSTEHDFTKGSKQYEWIENDLKQNKKPWLLFMGHRPMYVSSTFQGDHDIAVKYLQYHIEPLLLKYKVNMAFWGHHHSYQRSCYLNQNSCNANEGVKHVVTGAGGFHFSELGVPDHRFPFTNNQTWGVLNLQLLNSTTAHLRFHESATNQILDQEFISNLYT